MNLMILPYDFCVCKLKDMSEICFEDEFFFISKTNEELSLVCKEESLPSNITDYEKDWKAIKIDGILDFSLVGVLSNISSLLSNNSISIFAISTFNTDYILIKNKDFNHAVSLLKSNGHIFI